MKELDSYLNKVYSTKLKKLGFDGESILYYSEYSDDIHVSLDGHNNLMLNHNKDLITSVIAPTYSQVKDWLETEHNIFIGFTSTKNNIKFEVKKIFGDKILSNDNVPLLYSDFLTTSNIINTIILDCIDQLYFDL